VFIRNGGALHRVGTNFFQGGKFLVRKRHFASGKSAWFWFHFCHAIQTAWGSTMKLLTFGVPRFGQTYCKFPTKEEHSQV
jgi:hypothetical protein